MKAGCYSFARPTTDPFPTVTEAISCFNWFEKLKILMVYAGILLKCLVLLVSEVMLISL